MDTTELDDQHNAIDDQPQDEDKPREEEGPMVRVVAEHEPNLYGMLGLFPAGLLTPTMCLTDADGTPHTYYRAKSTPRYVLYKAAVTGAGAAGGTFSGAQR